MKLDELRTLIVAIDTSTDMLSCAVAWWTPEVFFDDRPSRASVEVLSSRDHLCRRRANVELVQTVREALDEAGMSMSDVGGFLVGRGPGSFTGVRIGISTAKGLARGANVPLMGTSTLDACASVSYTHLDVYKRQPLKASKREAVPEISSPFGKGPGRLPGR